MCVRTRHFLINLSENLKNKQAKKKKSQEREFYTKSRHKQRPGGHDLWLEHEAPEEE